MTHTEAFESWRGEDWSSLRNNRPAPTCAGELKSLGGVFHSDVSWEKFSCPECGKIIHMVGGGLHWWNYDRDPKPGE